MARLKFSGCRVKPPADFFNFFGEGGIFLYFVQILKKVFLYMFFIFVFFSSGWRN